MRFDILLSCASGLLSCSLAAYVYFKDTRSFAHRTFTVGMIALALEELLPGLSFKAMSLAEVVRWQRLSMVAAAFLPGSWLLFSLSFARANYKEFVAKWRWGAFAAFAIPLFLATVLGDSLFLDVPSLEPSSGWVLRLGWSGYILQLCLLLGMVVILVNLESTLRSSTGSIRWQIKFMVLGLGSLFAVRVYTSSQALLFSSVDPALGMVNAGSLIVADVLIMLSLFRARLFNVDIYLSQTFLYNSLTVLFVGIYLLTVGVLAKAVTYAGDSPSLPLTAFLVFLSLLGLTIVLLSDQLRQQIKRLISRHLKRPRYDYRKEWTTFTRRTSSLVDASALCAAVTKLVSETFGVSSVTVWLWDEPREHLVIGGSTVLSLAQAQSLQTGGDGAATLIRAMCDQPAPVDLDRSEAGWAGVLKQANPEYFRERRIRYCAPLVAGQEPVGVLTVNERLTKEPFSSEDFELLKTIADQVTGNLLNLKLSMRLLQAKEMEAFQTLSAFFVHDLKNLASTLALTIQNLPGHFDDPAFRNDALRAISQSVTKIDAMCNRLSLLSQPLELEQTDADVNELVTATLASLNSSLKASVVQNLRPVPSVVMDPDQMQKVLTNLILNANEAVGNGGEIRLTSDHRNGWIVLSVSDDGCGMSRAFMEQSLFRPFQTTKKRGLGIGLLHSKVIVEAHQGRIEVESEEGKGSTFRVLLPVSREQG